MSASVCRDAPLVLVIGSINIDRTTEVGSFPRPGETTLAVGSRIQLGGKGANDALTAADVEGLTAELAAADVVLCQGNEHEAASLLAAHGRDGAWERWPLGSRSGIRFPTLRLPPSPRPRREWRRRGV